MAMDEPLSGMAALITVGGGGIGSASACRLARVGPLVTIMGRSEATLQRAVEKIRADAADAARIQYFIGDATDSHSRDEALYCAATPEVGLHNAVSVVGKGGEIKLLLDEETFTKRLCLNVQRARSVLLAIHPTRPATAPVRAEAAYGPQSAPTAPLLDIMYLLGRKKGL